MKCPNCGFANNDNDNFCGNCGTKLTQTQEYIPITKQMDYYTFARELKRLPGYDSFGTKKEIYYLWENLYNEEIVYAIASGIMDGNTWLIACTSRRIIFTDCGMIYGVKQLEISLEKINSISYKNGMLLGEIHIQDGASTKTILNVQKNSTRPFVDAVHKAIDTQNNHNTIHLGNLFSIADELTKLKSLMDCGTITIEEFENQKKKLMKTDIFNH